MSKISVRMEARAANKALRAQVQRLQAEILKLPQCEPRTDHYFANGMYLRTVWSPAGTVIVGKVHKTEHFYIVLSGRVRVTTDDGVIELDAARDGPQIMTCPPGTKRAVLVLEDAWRMNVHRNPDNITDIEMLERELVEEDETSPFLPGNKLKQELLT
jgi:mannose-6-phosphate isomerase-like protein (cupin superfamily)